MSDEGIPYTESLISFDSELQPREGEQPLDEQEAADLLARRFGVTRPAHEARRAWNTVRQGIDALEGVVTMRPATLPTIRPDLESSPAPFDLMVHLVRMLPAEYRTESVLLNVDLRPVLAELIMTPEQARRNPNGVKYVNDVPFKASERVIAGELLVDEQQRIEDSAQVIATQLEMDGRFAHEAAPVQARRDWVDDQVHGWRNRRYEGDGTLRPTPQLLVEAAETEGYDARDAALQQLENTTLYQSMVAAEGLSESERDFQFLSQDDLEFAFGTDMEAWNSILNNLLIDSANKQESRDLGLPTPADHMIDTGGLLGGTGKQQQMMDLPGGQQRINVRGSSRIRLVDAFNALNHRDRSNDEIRNLQDKLIASGYLDEDDVRYWGMATDQATRSAWRILIRDSVSQGKDMSSMLAEATQAKRDAEEEENAKNQRDLVLSSSVGLQTNADLIGQQVLGRKLSESDHARLIEFIHSLEREQHNTLAPEGSQETEAIDIDAEVERYLYQEHGAEAGAYDLLEQVSVFNDFVRRPG